MAYHYKHGDRPLDDYTVQRAVGCGGFGEVYYAISDGGREVALKYLKDNPDIELRGVSHCINLKSPHLVSIFDVRKNADGDYFVIMEYCSGPSLRDLLIAEPNGFEPQKAAFFVRELAKGLGYLHDRGIVHRDMKPGNIFYDDGYVKIGDYGLSKFISVSRHSAQTASIGTVHYMAPEIGSGNYSRGVDIYALGVMLYEMLLGKVPFEGSSMGEVLMKHLTAQPEVDELPAPFAAVIRRALEKDPNDRYQTVHEMVDQLLEVEQVKQSLAGFSPKSLEGAVRMGAGTGDTPTTPIPSPNPAWGPAHDAPLRPPPPPRPQPQADFSPPAELPQRLSKKMDRISRKLEKKIAKLAGKPAPKARKASRQHDPHGHPVQGVGAEQGIHRGRRLALAALSTIVMALGLGFLVGNGLGAQHGVSAGMLALALTGGVIASHKANRWFGLAMQPKWPRRLVRAGCCAPLLAIGAAPILAHGGYGAEGLSIWIGLVLLAVFARWERDIEHGKAGEMHFWTAVWTAAGAFMWTAIVGSIAECDHDEFFVISAGAAGVASLVIQEFAWAGRRPADATGPPPGDAATQTAMPEDAKQPKVFVGVFDAGIAAKTESGQVGADPSRSGFERSQAAPDLRRWGATRAFWGMVSFLFTSGAIVLALVLGMVDLLNPEDEVGVIIGIVGCGLGMLFALRRTTPLRVPGFWRETLRPFLLTILSFGIAAAAISLGQLGDTWRTDGPRIVAGSGIAIGGLLLVIVLFCRGRRTPKPLPPFLKEGDDADAQPG